MSNLLNQCLTLSAAGTLRLVYLAVLILVSGPDPAWSGTVAIQTVAPAVPADADAADKQPAIDPFQCELKPYDSNLDPKYIEQDHSANQAKLSQAAARYKSDALDAYNATIKGCSYTVGSTCAQLARERYETKLRGVAAAYDQFRLTDDENYRTALAQAKDRIKQAEEEEKKAEEEQRKQEQARAESLQKKEEQFRKEQVRFQKHQLETAANETPAEDIISQIDSSVISATAPRGQAVLPPEEFLPQRVTYPVHAERPRHDPNETSAQLSDILARRADTDAVRQRQTGEHDRSSQSPAIRPQTLSERDSLIIRYKHLLAQSKQSQDTHVQEQLQQLARRILALGGGRTEDKSRHTSGNTTRIVPETATSDKQ